MGRKSNVSKRRGNRVSFESLYKELKGKTKRENEVNNYKEISNMLEDSNMSSEISFKVWDISTKMIMVEECMEEIKNYINSNKNKRIMKNDLSDIIESYGVREDIFNIALNLLEEENYIYQSKKGNYISNEGGRRKIAKVYVDNNNWILRDGNFEKQIDYLSIPNNVKANDFVYYSIDKYSDDIEIHRKKEKVYKKEIGEIVKKNNEKYIVLKNKKYSPIKLCDQNISVGDLVLFQVNSFSKNDTHGFILEDFGNKYKYDNILNSILKKNNLSNFFLDCEQRLLNDRKKYVDKHLKRYKDFTYLDVYNIKDENVNLGISIDKFSDGIKLLGIHIPNVSEYIEEDSLLDRMSMVRGKTYLCLDEKVNMLPSNISDTLCEFNKNKDTICLSYMVEFNKYNQIISQKAFKSIVNCNESFDYSESNNMLNDKQNNRTIEELKNIVYILHKRRLSSLEGSVKEKSKDVFNVNNMMEELNIFYNSYFTKCINKSVFTTVNTADINIYDDKDVDPYYTVRGTHYTKVGKKYAEFTSPLNNYVDLFNQRMANKYLNKECDKCKEGKTKCENVVEAGNLANLKDKEINNDILGFSEEIEEIHKEVEINNL